MVLLTQVPDADVDAVAGELLLGWEIGDAQRAARLRARGESDDVIDDARHDAEVLRALLPPARIHRGGRDDAVSQAADQLWRFVRSEENTSELQSLGRLVCSLVLETNNLDMDITLNRLDT